MGLVEYGEGSGHGPRPIRGPLRLAVWGFLAFFAVVTFATTALSLGAYCLTSDGANTRALHAIVLEAESSAP